MTRIPLGRLLALAVLFLMTFSPLEQALATGTIVGQINAKQARLRKNAVVYLERVKGTFNPPAKMPHIDQKNQEFVPFVLPVVRGTTVEFLNSDPTGHNIFTPDGEKFDLGVFNKGETRKFTFNKEGVYTLLCKMHPSMVAFVVVTQNPFAVVAGEDGSFRLENVPAGQYTLKVWTERKTPPPQSIVVTDGQSTAVTIELK